MQGVDLVIEIVMRLLFAIHRGTTVFQQFAQGEQGVAGLTLAVKRGEGRVDR